MGLLRRPTSNHHLRQGLGQLRSCATASPHTCLIVVESDQVISFTRSQLYKVSPESFLMNSPKSCSKIVGATYSFDSPALSSTVTLDAIVCISQTNLRVGLKEYQDSICHKLLNENKETCFCRITKYNIERSTA